LKPHGSGRYGVADTKPWPDSTTIAPEDTLSRGKFNCSIRRSLTAIHNLQIYFAQS
jgi:hypothetical protein